MTMKSIVPGRSLGRPAYASDVLRFRDSDATNRHGPMSETLVRRITAGSPGDLCEDCLERPGVVWMQDKRFVCSECGAADIPRRAS